MADRLDEVVKAVQDSSAHLSLVGWGELDSSFYIDSVTDALRESGARFLRLEGIQRDAHSSRGVRVTAHSSTERLFPDSVRTTELQRSLEQAIVSAQTVVIEKAWLLPVPFATTIADLVATGELRVVIATRVIDWPDSSSTSSVELDSARSRQQSSALSRIFHALNLFECVEFDMGFLSESMIRAVVKREMPENYFSELFVRMVRLLSGNYPSMVRLVCASLRESLNNPGGRGIDGLIDDLFARPHLMAQARKIIEIVPERHHAVLHELSHERGVRAAWAEVSYPRDALRVLRVCRVVYTLGSPVGYFAHPLCRLAERDQPSTDNQRYDGGLRHHFLRFFTESFSVDLRKSDGRAPTYRDGEVHVLSAVRASVRACVHQRLDEAQHNQRAAHRSADTMLGSKGMPPLELSTALYAGQVCQNLALASTPSGTDDEEHISRCEQHISAGDLLARAIVSNDGVMVQVIHILWCVELFAAGRDVEVTRELNAAMHYVPTMEAEWGAVVTALHKAVHPSRSLREVLLSSSVSETDSPRLTTEAHGLVSRDEGQSWLVTMVQRVADTRTRDKVNTVNLPDWDRHLSDRERQIMERLSHDLTNREIAQELFLSVRTVEAHVLRIRRKLGIRKRRDLVRIAREAEAWAT